MRLDYFKNQTLRPYPILYITTLGYLIYLLRFYIREYEVPDYFLYEHFAKQKLPAKDGFSSLFIFLSQKLTEWYDLIHILLALSLPLSFLIINLAFFKNVESSIKRVMFLLLTISMGCWHYFYGKIYYEFPFIALNFALILLISGKKLFYENDSESYTTNYKDILLYLLIGFCFSWKAHSIFLIIGILYLLYVNKYLIITFKNYILVGSFIVIGYVIGNYQLIFNFSETVIGLNGYKAESDIKSFLFHSNSAWDHINLSSFNNGNINIISLLIILLVMPFFIKNKLIIIFNISLLIAFLLITKIFLAGYLWQGFSFSLFIILMFSYCLANINIKSNSILVLVSIMIVLQLINNFIIYLPKQIEWYKKTDIAIQVLESKSSEVYIQVKQIIAKYCNKYIIDISLKRSNRNNLNPIEVNNKNWSELFRNQCRFNCNAECKIIIEPKSLRNLEPYKNIIEYGDDYIISLPEYLLIIK